MGEARTMSISLTKEAAGQMRQAIENRGKGRGIRLGVTTSGCSGFAYVMEFVDELQPDDQVFPQDGFDLVVDKKSLVYLDGTEVDFVREGLNEGFKFNNPNSKAECGCGESFTV
jgi:iron-sulfur cluster assembly protein